MYLKCQSSVHDVQLVVITDAWHNPVPHSRHWFHQQSYAQRHGHDRQLLSGKFWPSHRSGDNQSLQCRRLFWWLERLNPSHSYWERPAKPAPCALIPSPYQYFASWEEWDCHRHHGSIPWIPDYKSPKSANHLLNQYAHRPIQDENHNRFPNKDHRDQSHPKPKNYHHPYAESDGRECRSHRAKLQRHLHQCDKR